MELYKSALCFLLVLMLFVTKQMHGMIVQKSIFLEALIITDSSAASTSLHVFSNTMI